MNTSPGSQVLPTPAGRVITTLKGRYVDVSEYAAEMADYDSPAAMIGLYDADMPWVGNDGNNRRVTQDALVAAGIPQTITNWAMTAVGWRCFAMRQELIQVNNKPHFQFISHDLTACEAITYQWLHRICLEKNVLHLGPLYQHATLTAFEIACKRLHLQLHKVPQMVPILKPYFGPRQATPEKIKKTLGRVHDILNAGEAGRPPGQESLFAESGLRHFIMENDNWYLL